MGPGKRTRGGKKPPRPPAVLPDSVATCCLAPSSKTMVPRKRTPDAKSTPCGKSSPSVLPDPVATPHRPPTSNTMPEISDQEDIDLSSLRARNILRNNQYAQRLGVRRLAELLQSSFAKKRSVEKSFEKKSKALLLEEDVGNSMLPPGDCVKAGTGRTSKRVLAPENNEETMRCTRQRAAREQMSTTSLIEATEGGLEPELSANQNQGETNNIEQGNLTLSTEVEPMGLNTTEGGTLTGTRQVGPRGKSMGKEIDSISRGLGTMIPIIVKEGKRRPEAPMQAAKLASESGIIIRQHIPIYTNWIE